MSLHDGIPGEFPPIVRVTWHDSYLASEGWTDRSESIESSQAMLRDPIHAAGFLIHHDNEGIVLASSWNQHADDVEGAIAIPARAIVFMEKLHDGFEGS